MLKGLALPLARGSRSGPGLRAAASLGGLRTIRQGRNRDREVQEFIEELVSGNQIGENPGASPVGGAGRGSGSYERFIKAHKDTVVSGEGKRFKRWTNWKNELEDYRDDDMHEDLTESEQSYLGQAMTGAGARPDDGDEKGGERNKRQERGGRNRGERRRGSGEDGMVDDTGSYFDWNKEELFIPRLRGGGEWDEGTNLATDKILREDDLQMRVNKLLWRRLKVRSRDMDLHVPQAWDRSRTLRNAMEETRSRLAARAAVAAVAAAAAGEGEEKEKEREEEVAAAAKANKGDKNKKKKKTTKGKLGEEGESESDSDSDSDSDSSDDEYLDDDLEAARARRRRQAAMDPAVQEVKRLNNAKTVDEIEKHLGRLLVESKLDLQFAQNRKRHSVVAPKRGKGGVGGKEDEEDDEGEEEEEDGMRLDEWSRIHLLDLEEAIGDEIPTMDPQEEGFEAFREYADQLIDAGGVIEYRFTQAENYDREMDLPLPLATGRALETSLKKDKAALAKATSSGLAGSSSGGGEGQQQGAAGGDDLASAAEAFAWLALNKNPNIGENIRGALTEELATTIKRLQEAPDPLDVARAKGKAAAAERAKKAAAGGGGGKKIKAK